jgi:beta-N-acetylhexosaminidase
MRTHRIGRHLRPVVAGLAAVAVVGTGCSAAIGGQAAHACDAKVNLSTWSTARLAAQTVVVPSQASQVTATARLVATGYGGILLFGTSAPSNLGATLAHLETTTPQDLGMFVMTDEEGGGVLRLDNLVAPFPWARTMAETMAPAQITALARRVGSQLLRAGVNMDLARVLDVDGRDVEPGATDPDGYRSFSGSISVVITDGNAFATGLEHSGVVPVVKHFPGLGGSTGNTDDGPAATLPWSRLKASTLHTFESAINRGIPAIMVSNATIPGLTSRPASISANVITGVLRDWLKFKGLIVTDSLTAGAISAVPLSVPHAAVDAISAGADMVLLGAANTPTQSDELAISVANAISAAVTAGTLPRATLVDAVATILATRGIEACTA